MTPRTLTPSPAASTFLGVPVAPTVSVVACDGAFEEDGWAVAPGFFLGTMDDGAVDEENDDEDDALRTLLGFAQALPPT